METKRTIGTMKSATGSQYHGLLGEVGAMFDDVLMKATIDAKTDVDRANARLLVLTDELDQRRLTEAVCGLSTKDWLRSECRMTAREASGTVKTARALAKMPAVAQQAVTGEIVTSGVKLLAMTRDRHPQEFTDHEATFVNVATNGDSKDLRVAVSEWEQDVNYNEAVADAQYDAWGREVFFNQSYQGRWDMHATFGVADGHVINTALQGYVQASFLNEHDNRPIYECYADATVGIHQFWLDHNNTVETSGGEKPHITVTVPYDILTGTRRQLPELDGYAIDPETLKRWACDAGIVRIITNGDSQPIDVGRRTRTIPPALRRALDLRDKGCVWTGCGAPASWCDAHHIIHWANGGETSLENCQLLCRRHHTRIHSIEATGRAQGSGGRPDTPRSPETAEDDNNHRESPTQRPAEP